MPILGDLAVRLILAAVLVLSASQAGAEVIGHERGILGSDEGFFRPRNGVVVGSSVVIAALPYARTVTCGSYTLTGTAPGAGAVTWSASPSGSSGSCTGTTSWSCVVDVDPDASGEGVEVITVAQSGASSAQATLGFYVEGEHSCFLSQSVDGTYNSTRVNLDPVATWENLGSSALDVTQATGSAQPTFRTSIVGGQPIVRCDGGDSLAASTASDWIFVHNGSDSTLSGITLLSSITTSTTIVGTRTITSTSSRGSLFDVTSANAARMSTSNGSGVVLAATSAGSIFNLSVFSSFASITDDDGGGGNDGFVFVDGASVASGASSGGYSTNDPAAPLTICSGAAASRPVTGDLFRVLIYQSALSATQRDINKAVDEWALGGTLPVTP